MSDVQRHLSETIAAISAVDVRAVETFIRILWEARERGNRIFFFGNGGSGATASHFAQDLAKGTIQDMAGEAPRFKSLSLADNTPGILAWANDEGYETIFVQQLINLGEPGDVVVGISGSGNSPNVLRAIEYANAKGMTTVGLTGFDGGKLARMVGCSIHVPVHHMGIAESVHTVIMHAVISYLTEHG